VKISIALATYNGERFLQEQLDSLAAQTLRPCELVVGDDGSTDGTLEILERFAERVPFPVHIQRNPANLGFADNFLATAGRCSGDFIAFSDQDDVWLPRKLERHAIALSSEFRPEIVASQPVITDTNLKPIHNYTHIVLSERIALPQKAPLNVLTGHSITFHRNVLSDFPWRTRPFYRGTQKRIAHDQWISIVGYLFSVRYILNEKLILWRRHSNAATNWQEQADMQNIRGWFKNNWRTSQLQYKHCSFIWQDIARWCEESTELVTAERRVALGTASKVCRQVAQWYETRSIIFTPSVNRFKRTRETLRLLQGSAYSNGFGALAFAKDVVRCIL
jgi:glycosyltransferase involved in cell wall biosynthesis